MNDIPNAFIGRTDQPSREELNAVLGRAAGLWTKMVTTLAEQGASAAEWHSVSPKYGWRALRVKQKQRTIIYLSPCKGCLRVSFVLGGRAVAAAQNANLPKTVVEALAHSPRYAEGTGLRLTVRNQKDLPAIQKLTAIKMAN